ncbi:unnamed protein product [marine sediment metagenome]|uniref:Uncharacterized protein n=1 Tax=marine sediment metagenome TaxID=412755 RepID=X0TF56_9ZZZZ
MDIKSIRKVNIKKGDVIVIYADEHIPNIGVARIKGNVKKIFPDNKVVIMDGGLKLSIVKVI